jgi:dipeptidyl aminopeptidase/acylaminoacyl peptidase
MKVTFILGSLVLTAFSVFAQSENNTWAPEDIVYTEKIYDETFSPDNKKVLWRKNRPVKEDDKFSSDLYLTRLNEKSPDGLPVTIQLTNSDERDYNGFFSADSKTVYFLSSREEGKKLWKLSLYGGEAQEVHEFEHGISSVQRLNDSTLYFLADEGKTLHDRELEEQQDNTIVVEDSVHWKISRLYTYNLNTGKIRRITENQYPINQYAYSSNGRWLITGHTMSRHYAADAQPKPRYYLYDRENDTRKEILQDLQTPRGFQFTNNSEGFYFTSVRSSDPQWSGAGINLLHYYDLSLGRQQEVPLDHENGLGQSYGEDFGLTKSGFIASLASGARLQLAYYSGTEGNKTLLDFGSMSQNTNLAAVSDDGTKALFAQATASMLPRYYVADLSEKREQLTTGKLEEWVKLNHKLKQKPKTRRELLTWAGANNEEVTGILYYPMNYEEGRQYPLLLSIHGGPSGVDIDFWSERWSTYPHIFAQKGAFVLKPNYHGSGNHGQEFVESIKGNYYDLEMVDIMNGVNKLINEGLVDEEKLGTMGWSNGAILTTMLTLRYPETFKAATPGAGDVNWTSDYGTCRFGVQFDQSYFGGAPWDDTGDLNYNPDYIRLSPLFDLEKVVTPTLIFHGSEDRAVPRDQGFEYFRALQQSGQAPHKFLWFPGQPHGLQKISHQLRKMNEEIDWIEKYVLGTYKEENEAFKEDSPLALLLKREQVACHEDLYGVIVNNTLLPEVVKVKDDSVAFGRFEVTNAQYRAYDDAHTYMPTAANEPVRGMGIEQARAYVAWLSGETGKTYRLPNAKEAKAFHELAIEHGPEENTLNHWAGYTPTPEEARMLKAKLEVLKGSLVKPVGSFEPLTTGEAILYDVGGNVAEYSEDGTTYGFSAYLYVDAAQPEVQVDKDYSGFRVVLEP